MSFLYKYQIRSRGTTVESTHRMFDISYRFVIIYYNMLDKINTG